MTAPSPEAAPFGFSWLLRLRGLAVIGQMVTCVGAVVLFQVRLPWEVLAAGMGVTLGTNFWAARRQRLGRDVAPGVPAALVLLDLATLTVMLFGTGGVASPFLLFYLLHVTIAAILLPPRAAWTSVAAAAAGVAVLFFSPFPLVGANGPVLAPVHAADLTGGLVGLAVAAGFLAFFVGKLRTELVRREAQLAEARLLRARNERFASLATLSAGVAHELATPLATIAVVAGEMEAVAASEDARLIRLEVERCRRVLERLSDQATNGSGDEMEIVRLGDLPARLEPFLRPDIFRRADFDITNPDATVVVPVEAMLQSLAVVVKNAVEASAPGGRVDVRLRADGEAALLEVVDWGAGMAPGVRARVGEPFFTTKQPGRGMGLGLFLVRMFVERVGGRLLIDSAPGMGTTVRLFVPLAALEEGS